MAASMPPTRHDLLIALRFPVLAGPFLLVTLRYRFFGPHVWSARFRDGVDFNREAWRLSAYLTVLFVLVAYPVVLSKHDDWLWSVHAQLFDCLRSVLALISRLARRAANSTAQPG